nr:increased DNA methylation 1-like [Tanacetum cinerariifolium]
MANVIYSPEYNPQTIMNYYSCGVQTGRCSNPHVKNLIEKAKNHLPAIGWMFFYVRKKTGTKELRLDGVEGFSSHLSPFTIHYGEPYAEPSNSRAKAILVLALQFDDACTTKDDLRKAYGKYNDIPQESRALIDKFLKEGSDKDYELNLSINKNDPWELSLDTDDSDLHLTPVLRPSVSICVEPSLLTSNPVRIIPGPAGIVQAAKLLK